MNVFFDFFVNNPLFIPFLILLFISVIVYFLTERGGMNINGVSLSIPNKKGRKPKKKVFPFYLSLLILSFFFLIMHFSFGRFLKNNDYKKEDWIGTWNIYMEFQGKLIGPYEATFELNSHKKVRATIAANGSIVLPSLEPQNDYHCIKGNDLGKHKHLYELMITPDKTCFVGRYQDGTVRSQNEWRIISGERKISIE